LPGLIGVGALLTFWLNSRVYRMTEQGHITDRYSKAIEQLGDDQLTIRLGGIYALERIARDSERDHPTVVEVLSAFVQEEGHGAPTTAPDLTIAEVLGALVRGRSGPAEVPQSSPDPIGDNGPNESELPPNATAAFHRRLCKRRDSTRRRGVGGQRAPSSPRSSRCSSAREVMPSLA
jgi:hypothetical protein